MLCTHLKEFLEIMLVSQKSTAIVSQNNKQIKKTQLYLK